MASLNSSPEEEEAPTPPQEDTPPAGSLAQDLLSPGDLSRTESMYYTPDTTLEKLSDVLGDKE